MVPCSTAKVYTSRMQHKHMLDHADAICAEEGTEVFSPARFSLFWLGAYSWFFILLYQLIGPVDILLLAGQ